MPVPERKTCDRIGYPTNDRWATDSELTYAPFSSFVPVNEPLTEAEFKAVQRSVERGCPFGGSTWSERTVNKLGLESTLRAHGRPKKQKNGSW